MRQSGFSLVELSIVLVILGLLTGGILAGQSLIRAAELRSVSAQLQQNMTLFYSFRDKYFALPGDMTNATAFWGEAGTGSYSGACPGTNADPSTDTGTCDGNGDGRLAPSTNSVEQFRAWQHLANAGMIEGSYTGVQGPAGNIDGDAGDNVPRGKLSNSGFSVDYIPSLHASYYPALTAKNIMRFGADAPSSNNNPPVGQIFTSEEAWNIDTKLDDGRPGYGKVIVNNNSNCATTTTDSTAEYALSVNVVSCHLAFTNIF